MEDFVAHNQSGMAHDQLVDALLDRDVDPAEPTSALVEQANSVMLDQAKP